MTEPVFAEDRRAARLFLIALAGYFAAQVALRCALGGAFEADEAEMVILNRAWHLAAGSQTPLYDWWQALWFQVFGTNTFALVAPKNILLFGTYAAMFAGLRRVVPQHLAMVGALSLILLPNLSWWAQRTGSHTIALVFMVSVTVWAFLRLLQRPDTRGFVLFGLAVGLGGLAKVNYWLVPIALVAAGLSMPGPRAALRDRRLALAAAIAAALVALPYGWMLLHPGPTFSDTWEFYKDGGRLPWLAGLGRVLAETLAGTAPLLIALAIGLACGLRFRRGGDGEGVLLRAAAIGLVLVCAVIVGFNASFVRARWLLPLFMLAGPVLTIALFRDAGRRGIRNYLIGIAALAALLLAGIADVRLRGAGSDSLRIAVMAEQLEAELGEVPVIVGPHYYTDNLALHRPGWSYLPPYPSWQLSGRGGQVLVLGAPDRAQADRWLAEHGVADPAAATVLRQGRLYVPYRFTDGESRQVDYWLMALPAAN
jgi:4-amino-4-deoxy-L-arabinose transferase-like glycosyltransferase